MSLKPISREAAQSNINGTLVARMIMDFSVHMRGVYLPDTFTSSLCAAGPLQTMIGIAIQKGWLTVTEEGRKQSQEPANGPSS